MAAWQNENKACVRRPNEATFLISPHQTMHKTSLCLQKRRETGTPVVSRVLWDLEGWQAANESSQINGAAGARFGLWVLTTTVRNHPE